ncbi:sugar ABC transporter substrate-binding protein [Blautia schinkii]|nr:sugar ABC transporter substrate-binding protein [Blautia schinkii]
MKKKLSLVLAAGMLMSSFMFSANVQAAETGDFSGMTLNVIMQDHSAVTSVIEVKDEFEKATGASVNIETLPQSEVISKTQLTLSSQSSDYDVVMFDHKYTTQFAEAGWIVPLSDFIDAEDYDTSDFMQGFVSALSYNDKVYGLPFYGESTMLMYNKEMFEAAGIDGAPKTAEEFWTACEKLKEAGYNAFACRANRDEGQNVYIWTGFFLGAGADWFDADGKLSINTPEAVAGTEAFINALQNYSINGVESYNWDNVQLAFQQGSIAMAIDATNFAARLEDESQSTVVGKVGYSVVPEGLSVPSTSTWGLGINSASKNQELAWEFIKWCLGEDIMLKTSIDGLRADVTRSSVMNSEEYTTKYAYEDGNWIKVVIDSMNAAPADYEPRITDWSSLGDSVATAVSKALDGDDIQSSLDAAQEESSDITDDAYIAINR